MSYIKIHIYVFIIYITYIYLLMSGSNIVPGSNLGIK